MSEASLKDKQRKDLNKWQNQLFPFMKYMLIIFSVFFLLASLFQLYYMHREVSYENPLNIETFLDNHAPSSGEQDVKWLTVSKLEEHALSRRYHQANVSLMAGIWMKYLGFLTGMIICLTGAVFIMGKIETSSESKMETDSGVLGKNSLTSSSPGLFLVFLGVMLMIFINQFENKLDLTDGPAYINVYPSIKLSDQPQNGDPETTKEFTNAERNNDPSELPDD